MRYVLSITAAVVLAFAVARSAEPGTPTETILVDSNGARNDAFGGGPGLGPSAVAMDGDVIAIGAAHDDIGGEAAAGSVTVFRSTGGIWVEEQELTASDGAAEDIFGRAVGVSGDVIVVGAILDDVGGNLDQGSAIVFRWNGTSWAQEQVLVSSNGATGDGFGTAAISGDVIVVGAAGDDIGANLDQGSATVFRWNGTTWVEEQELTSASGAAGDAFGSSVSVSGDVIVVGTRFDSIGGNVWQGSATVFRWNGSAWSEEQLLTAATGGASDLFGMSVAVSGDVIVIGAVHAVSVTGSATVFRWNGSSWVEEARLTSSAGGFGGAVSVDQDVIVVGAYLHDVGGNVSQGSADVFRWNGSSWVADGHLIASDGMAQDSYGCSVAVAAETVVIGSPWHDVAGSANQGAAYVYDVTPSPWMDLGGGTGGIAGLPVLTMSGPLTPLSRLSLDLVDGPPVAVAVVFISFSSTPVPFLGGILHTFPPAELLVLGTDPAGGIHGSVVFPTAPSGAELWFQIGMVDASVPVHGATLSNGVKGTVP